MGHPSVRSARLRHVAWTVVNQRVSSGALLITLDRPRNIKVISAALNSSLERRSAALMAQAPKRCTRLSVLYASAGDLRRNLSLSALPAVPSREGDPYKAEKILLSLTKAQVLVLYGSPNEPGTLPDILKLPHWSYGSGGYDDIQIDFGAAGRVTRAVIARSP